jgi:hypothetical protein
MAILSATVYAVWGLISTLLRSLSHSIASAFASHLLEEDVVGWAVGHVSVDGPALSTREGAAEEEGTADVPFDPDGMASAALVALLPAGADLLVLFLFLGTGLLAESSPAEVAESLTKPDPLADAFLFPLLFAFFALACAYHV